MNESTTRFGANAASAEAVPACRRTVQALESIDLTLYTGELVALVGPTGSGKTTLLMLLAGLTQPDRGTITLADQPLHALTDDALTDWRSRTVGVVYQEYNLFPGFTVRDNIGLPLRLMSDPPYDATARANQLIATFA